MTYRERLIGIVKSSLIKHIGKSCCLAENIVDDLLAENVTTLPVDFSDNRRERMIELLDGYYEETGINIVHYFTDEESEMLADYILADGWIRPPYKIGSKLYHNIVGEEEPQEYTVVGFYCEEEPKLVHCEFVYNGKTYSHTYDIDDEGKSYYTSKEEAEKALKERETE